MGNLAQYGVQPEDIIGTIRYNATNYNTAIVQTEFAVNMDIYNQWQADRVKTHGVLLAIDKSGSMGAIMGTDQERISVVASSILAMAKRYFDRQNGTDYIVPLSIVFFDTTATLGTFTDYPTLELFVQTNAVPGLSRAFYTVLNTIDQ